MTRSLSGRNHPFQQVSLHAGSTHRGPTGPSREGTHWQRAMCECSFQRVGSLSNPGPSIYCLLEWERSSASRNTVVKLKLQMTQEKRASAVTVATSVDMSRGDEVRSDNLKADRLDNAHGKWRGRCGQGVGTRFASLKPLVQIQEELRSVQD